MFVMTSVPGILVKGKEGKMYFDLVYLGYIF